MSENPAKRVVLLMRSVMISAALTLIFAGYAHAQPTFTKIFAPNAIGPGSVSTLTFTIDNTGSGTPVTGLAFTDTLPAGMTIFNEGSSPPAVAVTDCTDAILSAPNGGGTITLSGGNLGGSSSCTVTVNVTSSTAGVHTNLTGALTSSAGSSGTATDDLTVTATLPGFSKSFSPGTVPRGGRTTLTFTVDNSANGAVVQNLDFTDTLPLGMEVADPPNASTTCSQPLLPATLTAAAGTNVITLDANGTLAFPALAANSTCTVTVDVIGTARGTLGNLSGELLADFVSAGKAAESLTVTVTDLALQKSFINDPAPPGSTVDLEFIIENFDRNFPATGVGFTDDLGAALAGLTFSSLQSNDCGGSVAGVGSSTITFSGGSLPAEGSCTILTRLTVPAAVPGAYVNTTGAVSGTVDGSPVVGNTASDTLFVSPFPILTKEFLEVGTLLPDPVVDSGDDVILRFTIENTSTTSGATDITFLDELTDGSAGVPPDLTTGFLPFPVSVTLPPVPDPPCGAGSSLALVSVNTDRQALQLTGGSLTAAPGAGATCTFDVTLTIPADFSPGTYTNTTEVITATVAGDTRNGPPASDTLDVIAAPQLVKVFSDDPVAPGGTVTLDFTLTYPAEAGGNAAAVTFTDDLDAALTGLAAAAGQLPMTGLCPAGNGTLAGTVGDSTLTFSGATLSPGDVCAFSLTLDVPAGAPSGNHTNTTSGVSATVGGLAATSPAASDDLSVQGLTFTKEFLGDPVIAGETVTLRFTIANVHPTADATITFFTDNLAAELAGLAATGAPSVNTCGGVLAGTTFLTYTGGGVLSGQTCTIEVDVLVPPGAADGTYLNVTSSLLGNQGGVVTIDPATDALTVDSSLLSLAKAFTDDPVSPGGTVTLEFTLSNLDTGRAASSIAFTDDLSAVLPGTPDLTFDSTLSNDCGATVSGTGSDMITVSGGALGAGASCTIQTSITIPAGVAPSTYTNTTSSVTGTIGGFTVSGPAATDTLEVLNLLLFSKAFAGPTAIGGTPALTFTITNPGSGAITGLSFSDNLDKMLTGLTATNVLLDSPPCGAGSVLAGTSVLTFTGGELAGGGTCSFRAELQVPLTAAVGTYQNTTSDLMQFGTTVAKPATADLTVYMAGDWNGDGLADMLWRNPDDGSNAVTYMDDTTELGTGSLKKVPPPWTFGAANDFNKDGLMDIVWRNPDDGRNFAVYYDDTVTLGMKQLPTVPPPWVLHGSGDFNQDDNWDLVWSNPLTGVSGVQLLSGTKQVGVKVLPSLPAGWQIEAVGDFDKDGDPDLLVRRSADGASAIAFLDGTVLAGRKLLPSTRSATICGAMDLDQDGNTDLLGRLPASGVNGVWYLENGVRLGVRRFKNVAPPWECMTGVR